MKKSIPIKRRTGDESRQSILAAACEVFAERGFEKASVREVAVRAGISVGGIYIYFKNKEELYTGLMKSQMDCFLDRIRQLGSEPPLTALRQLIEAYMDIAVTKTRMLSSGIKEYDLEFKRPIRDAFFREQRRILKGILERGVREGVFRPMACEETALIIQVTLRGAILGYLIGEIKKPAQYGKSLYTFILDSIRSKDHAK